MSSLITIAVAKGYLLKEATILLEKIGLKFDEKLVETRKLFTFDTTKTVKILQVRPWDVPVYVAQGAADIGIVGEDVLYEHNEKVDRLLDLKFGGCKLVLAGPKDLDPERLPHHLTVATKYPHCTETYFRERGLNVKMIKLYGSIELAPLTGLSDIICDLTATGQTLKEHELKVIDTLFSSTANLIANPMSMRTQYKRIVGIIDQLKPLINT